MASKSLVVSATGFPGTNETWRFINAAFAEPLAALARSAGHKTILHGLNPTATPIGQPQNYTSGFVVYNDEILVFEAGASNQNVTIIETITNVEYDYDSNNDGIKDILPGYKTRYMRFGTGGVASFPFSDLYRVQTLKQLSQFSLPANMVIDPAYVHTDNNFTTPLLNKLTGIMAGAEVNVQADWAVTNPLSDAFIANKPVGLKRILANGYLAVGDVTDNPEYTISFATPITIGYRINITFETLVASAALATASVFYTVHTKTSNSFKIQLKESGNISQNLRISYEVVEL